MQLHRYSIRHFNIRPLAAALIFAFSNVISSPAFSSADPNMNCTDIKVVFARGSGSQLGATNFQTLKQAFVDTFAGSGKTISFYELGSSSYGGYSYPSPGIGIRTWERFETSLGALFSGGEAYAYGESVEEGSSEAAIYIYNYHLACNTNGRKSDIILTGYSQGAQTISRTLQKIDSNWIFHALTFGDPKLYLPEGKKQAPFFIAPACRGEQFSSYRAYVPDCNTYQGILGGYKPYSPSIGYGGMAVNYAGKLSAYCNYHDVICSAYIDPTNLGGPHATYKEQGTYTRAAQDIYNLYYPNTYVRVPQDVAIVVDTSVDPGLLKIIKDRAVRLINRIYYHEGGKISLSYIDPDEGLVTLCGLGQCDYDELRSAVYSIEPFTNTRTADVMRYAYELMSRTEWEENANKAFVLFSTNSAVSNTFNPRYTKEELIELSRTLDPVNIYGFGNSDSKASLTYLAEATGGVFQDINEDDSSELLAEAILAHIPTPTTESTIPLKEATISNLGATILSDNSVSLSFYTDAQMSIVTINDFIAGYTTSQTIQITDLDLAKSTVVCLSPVSTDNLRSEPACIELTGLGAETQTDIPTTPVTIPKAPNTGVL